MITPLHHEARHSSGSEKVTGGFCMNHSSPLTVLKRCLGPIQQTPQPGVPRRTEAACFHVPMHTEQLGLLLSIPWPWGQSTGAVASNQLPPAVPLQHLHHLWGCCSSLLKVKEQADKPFPWKQRRDSLQLQSNSESGPGSNSRGCRDQKEISVAIK